MCPIFEYEDSVGHVTECIRSYERRDEPPSCTVCGLPTKRIEISKPHIEPDGIYSYAPNLGSAEHFERRLQAQRNGERIFKKELPA